MLSEEEKIMLEMIEDPVLWAEATLRSPIPGEAHKPLELRWYQKEVLSDKSLRKACRMGRRIGKCVSKDAKIATVDGEIRAEDLYGLENKPNIITFDEEDLKIKESSNYLIWPNGIKPVYELTTRLGRKTKVTGNHPFCILNKDGLVDWSALDDLKVGDKIAVPATYNNLISGRPIGRSLSRLLGYLVGDGGTTSRGITFTNIDEVILEDLNHILKEYKSSLKLKGARIGEFNISGIEKFKKNQSKIIKICKEHGLFGKKATEKSVPDIIKNSTLEDISNFVGAYWDCDGWVSISKGENIEIGVSSASKELVYDIQHLLLRFNINSAVRYKGVKYKGKIQDNWIVTITNKKDVINFLSSIKMVLKGNKTKIILEKLAELDECFNSPQCIIPRQINNYLDNISKNISDREIERNIGTRIRRAYSPTKDKLSKYAEFFNDDYLKSLCNSDVIWDEIISIEYAGEEETYDLTVYGTHTLISDDIISHNTTTMVIHILWYAFTHQDSKQLISTPYDSQVQMIFEMIRSFIRNSPGLQGSVVNDTKNPSRIILTNGAMISGFTAGTKSGSKGGSMRGQAADWIYLDEIDFMDDASFQAITAVAIERPSIGIWVASTPSGRRGMFWKICTGKITRNIYDENQKLIDVINVWKEFYHPSMDNPSWNPDMEKEFREMFDEENYRHEVCLTPGQLINTKDCYKPIEEIEVGDMVLTHQNRYRPVKKCFKRYIDEEIFKIYCNKESIAATHNHPIYVLGDKRAKWAKAETIKAGDRLLTNNRFGNKYRNHTTLIVTETESFFYHGYVYNIEVEEDNSYCVENKIVHNCAEFGEETIGVFKKDYIDIAKKQYNYEERKRMVKAGPRILGVDWDKYASASQAVIIEYNLKKKRFSVIARHETPKSEFTLTNAVNRIIEMNREYDLDFIYVDRGYGEHQIETLHKYGMDHPQTGLTKKVFGIHFGESKEIKDPFTKKKTLTPIKPFMVNQLVQLFEAQKIDISDMDEMIIRQLEAYQVIKKTIFGQPVYTSTDEHALDCMMLCVLGFVERYPKFISDVFVIKHSKELAKVGEEKEAGGELMEQLVKDSLKKAGIVEKSKFIVPKKIDIRKMPKNVVPNFKRNVW